MLIHERRDLLVLFRASFLFKFSFPLDVPDLCYNPYCEKLKSMCENLGAVYSSHVNGKRLYERILDCKVLILRCAT